MIKSFADAATEEISWGQFVPEFPAGIQAVALRKLEQLNAATELSQLMSPPGNRLHRLTQDRSGQYAVRINRKYRLCFRWDGSHAHDVEITDYH